MSFNRFRFFLRCYYEEIGFFIHHIKANLKKVISHVYEAIVCFILKRINLDKIDKNGNTPLQRAFYPLDYMTAVRLIKCGANVNAMNRNGDTPLHSIARCGTPRFMTLLIEHGANVNAVDRNGNTPLHIGIKAFDENGCSVVIQEMQHEKISLLIEHEANVNAVGKEGITPLFSAVEKGNPEIVILLLKHGADVNIVNENGVTPYQSIDTNLIV